MSQDVSEAKSNNERVYRDLKVDDFKKLYKTDSKKHALVSHILTLYEHVKYTTMLAPSTLTIQEMDYLLKLYPDEKELHRAFKYFYKRECDKFNTKKKYLAKKVEIKKKKLLKYGENDEWEVGIFDSNNQLNYGLWHNSIMGRITKQSVRDLRNHKLRISAMFGQKIIVDLDYDNYMKVYETRLLAQQIGFLFYENKLNQFFPENIPFDIHFTNCASSHMTMEVLPKFLKQMDKMDSNFHANSYLEYPHLFPKKQLVYLSPHAQNPLRKYSHDHIYIIGGYNDKSSHMRVSNIKAQSEGIPCYRLPLDEYVFWKQGNKNLCLNQVVSILNSMKATEDWSYSIRTFAPQRKIKSSEELELEDEIRIRKVKQRLKNIERSRDR